MIISVAIRFYVFWHFVLCVLTGGGGGGGGRFELVINEMLG
jgi:hypothetical protein